jgi:hypothetical protein
MQSPALALPTAASRIKIRAVRGVKFRFILRSFGRRHPLASGHANSQNDGVKIPVYFPASTSEANYNLIALIILS